MVNLSSEFDDLLERYKPQKLPPEKTLQYKMAALDELHYCISRMDATLLEEECIKDLESRWPGYREWKKGFTPLDDFVAKELGPDSNITNNEISDVLSMDGLVGKISALAKRMVAELGVTRATLYRYVSPKGELRDYGTKVLGK